MAQRLLPLSLTHVGEALELDAGVKLALDPRNLGQRHVLAMVKVWQRRRLSPGISQTDLSFLRGLAMWLNKPGFIPKPGMWRS